MSDQTQEKLRLLLEVSERERASLRETIADVLSFQRLAETVGESLDLESLVEALASTLGRVVPWSAITVRIGAENSPAREIFARGMGPRAGQRFRELEEEAVVRWAMASLRPTLIPPMDGPDGVGWILVPLVVQHRTVGLAGLIPSIPGEQVTDHQMDMLRLIAAQAAAAMDNLGHMEDMRRNGGELRSLYEVASTLGRSLEVGHLFKTACQAIEERYRPLVVALGFVEPLGGEVRIFVSGAEPEACRSLLEFGMDAESMMVLGQDLSHGGELAGLGASVALVIPLAAGDQHLGALMVAHDQIAFAAPGVREWFGAVSRLLSASLENARLYEELMASARRMSELQSRMIQAGRLAGIGQLAGGIAHEINNPLQVILGRVQILQLRCEGQPSILTDLGRLESETMRIAQIVRGMQEFARQEGSGVIIRHPVALSVVVQSVLELVSFRLKRHRIEVVRTGFENPPVVPCDQDELKHLVLNLCLNAIQAMPGGGKLSINLVERGGQAVLEMGDTGPGIPLEDIDRIFDPFFTRRPNGTGMGLAIGYSIAQRHEGSMHAVPGLTEGALMRVLLPLYKQPEKFSPG